MLNKKILIATVMMSFSILSQAENGFLSSSIGRATFDGGDYDDEDMSLTFGGGVQASEWVAFEFLYSDYGEMTGNTEKIKGKSLTLSALGTYVIAEGLTIFGRMGVESYKFGEVGSGLESEFGNALVWGLGYFYRLDKRWTFTGELQLHNIELDETLAGSDVDLSTVSIGVKYGL